MMATSSETTRRPSLAALGPVEESADHTFCEKRQCQPIYETTATTYTLDHFREAVATSLLLAEIKALVIGEGLRASDLVLEVGLQPNEIHVVVPLLAEGTGDGVDQIRGCVGANTLVLDHVDSVPCRDDGLAANVRQRVRNEEALSSGFALDLASARCGRNGRVGVGRKDVPVVTGARDVVVDMYRGRRRRRRVGQGQNVVRIDEQRRKNLRRLSESGWATMVEGIRKLGRRVHVG
jgi:hypothetical protein